MMRWASSPRPLRLLAGFAVILFAGSYASAKPMTAASLEWLADYVPDVAVVKLDSVRGERVPPGVWKDRTFTTTVTEVLKGRPPAEAEFTRHMRTEDPGPTPGAEFLLFRDREGRLAAINLTAPAEHGEGVALTMDFQVLTQRDSILKAVRERLRRAQRGAGNNRPLPSLRLEVPDETPAFWALWEGSVCYLVVPAEPQFKPSIVRQTTSEDVWDRAEAARALAKYPGKKTENVLRSMLRDTGSHTRQEYNPSDMQTHEITIYPARQAAWEALRVLGVKVPQPVGYLKGLLPRGSDSDPVVRQPYHRPRRPIAGSKSGPRASRPSGETQGPLAATGTACVSRRRRLHYRS